MSAFGCDIDGCEYEGSFRGVTNHAIAAHPDEQEEIRKRILIGELTDIISDDVVPTFEEFNRQSGISFQPIETLFGTYQHFVEESGFNYHSLDKESIISELLKISEEYLDDDRPTTFDVRELATFSPETVQYHFGSMNAAFEEAGFEDIHYMNVSEDRLIQEICILEEKLDSVPSAREMDGYGMFSSRLYQRRFGSWNNAVEKAGFEPTPEHPEGEDNPMYGATGKDNPNYGNVGEDNPIYIHGSPDNPYSDSEYRRNRKKALKRAGYECERPDCTRTKSRHGIGLDCHHIIPCRMMDENDRHSLENLIILCREHHAELEPPRRWKN